MTRLTQAVVLAGGFGTRLGDATLNLPKPLMPVGGKPFLSYLLEHLSRQGIERFVISAGYRADVIKRYAEMMEEANFEIDVVSEPEPLGTGGALRHCLGALDEAFLVCNGDTIVDLNVAQLHKAAAGGCAIAVRAIDEVAAYGSVDVVAGRVAKFSEKDRHGAGLISAGSYVLTRDAVAELEPGPSSIEQDVLPQLAERGELAALTLNDRYFIDIGTPGTLQQARDTLPEWERKPIAFLDRDGVLNHDHGHVHTAEAFEWVEGAKDAVGDLNAAGYHVVLVTNQAGIAKGMYGESEFAELTRWMRDELWAVGAHLDGVFHCPFHEDGQVAAYTRPSYDRKPDPGMLFAAFRQFPSDVDSSFFVGDSHTDELAAEAAGVAFCRFSSGNLRTALQDFLQSNGAR